MRRLWQHRTSFFLALLQEIKEIIHKQVQKVDSRHPCVRGVVVVAVVFGGRHKPRLRRHYVIVYGLFVVYF